MLPQYGINLPWFMLLHSTILIAIGISNLVKPIRPPPNNRQDEYRTTVGSTFLTFGLTYLGTSYMPIEQNQLLHATVPLRFCTSAIMCWTWLRNRKNLTQDGVGEFLGTAVYDLVSTVALGWWLGTFSGRVPSS